jgi:GNAT superfamily N-acetyltransferase
MAFGSATGHDRGVIEELTSADQPACGELAMSRDWLRDTRKWSLLFRVGTVYGIREGGAVIGTAILTRYGGGLAAISMVLVAKHREGQGLGRKLMEHALAKADGDIVFLNATTFGKPLYENLGFVTVSQTRTHVGTFAVPPAASAVGAARLATSGDLAAIKRLDAEVVGGDRSALLDELPGFCAELRVLERDGEIVGYGGAWDNDGTLMLGPVIAPSIVDAKTLVAALAGSTVVGGDLVAGPELSAGRGLAAGSGTAGSGVAGSGTDRSGMAGGVGERLVRLEADSAHPELSFGLPLAFTTEVMVHGAARLPGDRARWFMPLMQALG